MEREELQNSVKANVSNQSLVKHMLATEAIMRALARRLGQNEEEWGLTGLLHDIDVELVEEDPNTHGRLGADLARELGASATMTHAILCHNEKLGCHRETPLDKALFCADPLSGLITSAALIRPDKKLAGLTPTSLMKRFKEKRFAAGVKREQIALCSEVGMDLEEFLALGLNAMKQTSGELGL